MDANMNEAVTVTLTPKTDAQTKARRTAAKRLLGDRLHPDSIGINKDGLLVIRWGFFYTHGRTSEQYATKVRALLDENGFAALVTDHGQVWKAFRGGASVANSSHFFVEVKVIA